MNGDRRLSPYLFENIANEWTILLIVQVNLFIQIFEKFFGLWSEGIRVYETDMLEIWRKKWRATSCMFSISKRNHIPCWRTQVSSGVQPLLVEEQMTQEARVKAKSTSSYKGMLMSSAQMWRLEKMRRWWARKSEARLLWQKIFKFFGVIVDTTGSLLHQNLEKFMRRHRTLIRVKGSIRWATQGQMWLVKHECPDKKSPNFFDVIFDNTGSLLHQNLQKIYATTSHASPCKRKDPLGDIRANVATYYRERIATKLFLAHLSLVTFDLLPICLSCDGEAKLLLNHWTPILHESWIRQRNYGSQ